MIKISNTVSVGTRGTKPLLLIAGPCQLESKELSFEVAGTLKELAEKYNIPFVFKSSYDKANRTSLSGARGMGIEAGLSLLSEIKNKFDVPVLTDVHSVEDINLASQVVDVLQIPAFLCRQTDLLLAAGKSNKTVNIKKGQFLHPADMKYAAEKVASTGNKNVMLCERGSCFGYRDLVVDMRGMLIMQEANVPIIYDATHSVQQMGGEGGSSGGAREYILPLARAAVALGIDGVFIECHPNPDKALSDAKSMLSLSMMDKVINQLVSLHQTVRNEN